MLAFIAIFFTSFLSIFILEKIDKKDIRDYIIIYPILTVISNSITILLLIVSIGHIDNFVEALNSEGTLFCTYCFISLLVNIILTFISIVLSKTLKIEIVEEKSAKKKYHK